MSSLQIPFVVFIGKDEVNKKGATVKNMKDGSQTFIENEALINYLKNLFEK